MQYTGNSHVRLPYCNKLHSSDNPRAPLLQSTQLSIQEMGTENEAYYSNCPNISERKHGWKNVHSGDTRFVIIKCTNQFEADKPVKTGHLPLVSQWSLNPVITGQL